MNSSDDLELAMGLAQQAADMMRAGMDSRSLEWKSDGSEVTDVELAINEVVVDAIGKHRPHDGVLGEEQSSNPERSRLWVVDPIDGTFPYASGIGLACFSIALVEDGAAKVAVCADPWTHKVWWATLGGGSWRNGHRVAVSDCSTLAGLRVDIEADAEFGPLMATLTVEGARAVCMWAAVRTGCAVADGSFDAIAYGPGKPWDVAATTLLISEAGGRVGCVDGQPLRLDRPVGRWLASAPAVWDQLAELWRSVTPVSPLG